jgi:hypothetical protein
MGVQIANCQVSCPVTITGEHANAFVDNMLIEEGYTFEFSESTIIRGNFTAAGDWPANRALSNIPD